MISIRPNTSWLLCLVLLPSLLRYTLWRTLPLPQLLCPFYRFTLLRLWNTTQAKSIKPPKTYYPTLYVFSAALPSTTAVAELTKQSPGKKRWSPEKLTITAYSSCQNCNETAQYISRYCETNCTTTSELPCYLADCQKTAISKRSPRPRHSSGG
jgi:hypothetical protein